MTGIIKSIELKFKGTSMSAKTVRPLRMGCFILLILVATRPSAAQSRVIRGVVTDAANSAVPNAAVELSCAQMGHAATVVNTSSKVDGSFEFQNTLIGVCKISIVAPGFTSALISISSSEKSEPVDVGRIRLRISCKGPGVICDEVYPAKTSVRSLKCLYLWKCGST
jgi:Carboxypeptidase regulatory-like domain